MGIVVSLASCLMAPVSQNASFHLVVIWAEVPNEAASLSLGELQWTEKGRKEEEEEEEEEEREMSISPLILRLSLCLTLSILLTPKIGRAHV